MAAERLSTDAKHTPGPWTVTSTEDDYGWLSFVVTEAEGVCSPDETAANARLIAAAPDLLDVLKAIVRAYDGPTVDVGTAVSSHIKKARATLAKAGVK